MEKYTRIYNYIEDYFFTVYEEYIRHYVAYPITYYHVDREETIWEDEYIFGGSYEKLGVGQLTGVKWRKIYSLPVFNFSQIQPNQESGEKGLTFKSSMTATFSLPSIYGLEPHPWDVIDANFGFKSDRIKISPLYVVNAMNVAHHGDYLKLYQMNIEVAPFNLSEIENQISSYWKFYEPTKEILPLENVALLYNILEKCKESTDLLNTKFNTQTGFYLVDQQ